MEEINATYGFVATKYELIIELKLLINYRSNNIYLDSFLYISLRLLCRSELWFSLSWNITAFLFHLGLLPKWTIIMMDLAILQMSTMISLLGYSWPRFHIQFVCTAIRQFIYRWLSYHLTNSPNDLTNFKMTSSSSL